VPITVGNTAPTVRLNLPPNGGFFDWGDQVRFSITVTDPEDGTIDCDDVRLQSILGHDTHGHPLDQYTGCDGTVQTTLSSGHSEGDNVFAVFEASYTDSGGAGGAAPLTGRAQAVLQPKHKQAEFFTATGRVADGQGGGNPGVQVETASDSAGGFRDIGSIEDGDWWSFDPTNLSNVDSIGFRVASNGGGGTIEVRSGATDGTLVGRVAAPQTGDWQQYTNVTLTLDDPPTSSGALYFVARRPDGSSTTGGLFNVNWVDFNGKGVTDNQRPSVTATATPNRGTAPLTVNFHAEATDAEGDNPLTYQWNFGVPGAPTPSTPDTSYTYTTPGSYEAMVTVTDARGAATTEHVDVVVDSPPVACLTGKSDDFLGASLDSGRWQVVRQNQDLVVRDGALHIPTTNTDIYGSDNSTPTPNVVLQPAPSGAWQATTKVSLTARDAYQQAGLILYGDDDNYAKMVLEGRGTASAADRVFQFIREENGQPNEVAESNTANLGAAYPDTVYVRLSSDGTRLTASYSADGLSWTNMPQTDKLIAGINNPRIGLISLTGTGSRPVIDAVFDWFQLVPDDTATAPTPNDEFDGSGLDGCRWTTVVRPDATKTRVTGGNLEIDTTTGDIYGGDNTGPKNFTLQTPPSGDWTVETKVDASAFNEAYHQGGLIVYTDDANYVKLDYVTDSATAKRIELRSEIGDAVQDPQPTANNLTQGVWHLRLVKAGDTYRGSYSADGVTWADVGVITNAAVSGGKVGLFAFGGNAPTSVTAKFDYFHASWASQPDETAPVTTATTDPANPGASGWYTGPVSVTLAATDAESGVDRTEYTVDGGPWTTYTAPFTVSGDKAHQVQYRSADTAGNVEEAKSLAVSIDATAPLTTAQFAPAGDNGWHAGAIPVTLAATDATSGVVSTEYSLDGGPWTAYTQPVDVSGDGTHTVAYRSADRAGNVETEKAATLKIDGTMPTVLISGIADRQVYGDSQDLRISWQAVDTTSGVRTLTGSLDGGSFSSGALLPLYTLSLGTHSLKVTAVDNAGNRTDQTVTFGISTSTRDIANLIDRFKAVGWINQATQKSLQDQLTKARKAEANGNDAKAIRLLREFRTLATDPATVRVAEVRDTLARDTDDVIARLS
jgi:regulation of enolase protein 1 (concanavalin A-like superfamily)